MKVQGTGTLVALEKPEKTCQRWQLRVPCGRDPLTGKYKTKTKRVTGMSKSQAQKALREFIAEVEGMSSFDANTVTVEAFANSWLESRRTQPNPPSAGTLRTEGVAVRTIVKGIGTLKVHDLDAEAVKDFYARLMSGECSLSGKPVSGTTAKKTASVLHAILRRAVRQHILQTNPCDLLEPGEKPTNDTGERHVLSDEETAKIVAEVFFGQPESHRVGVALALGCGLRREELLGLAWEDVDLNDRTIRVRHAYSQDGLELKEPKSKAGNRSIELYPELVDLLTRWRKVQHGELLSLGIQQSPWTPVVTSAVGGRIHPVNYSRWWKSYTNKLGITSCGIHTLRHMYVTGLSPVATDLKTVQDLMGDSTGSIALNVYTHGREDNRRKSMNAYGEWLMGLVPDEARKASGAA